MSIKLHKINKLVTRFGDMGRGHFPGASENRSDNAQRQIDVKGEGGGGCLMGLALTLRKKGEKNDWNGKNINNWCLNRKCKSSCYLKINLLTLSYYLTFTSGRLWLPTTNGVCINRWYAMINIFVFNANCVDVFRWAIRLFKKQF